MADTDKDTSLVVIHRCESCQHPSRARELNDDSTVTGIFICPACGHAGPLHPEVISKAELGGADH